MKKVAGTVVCSLVVLGACATPVPAPSAPRLSAGPLAAPAVTSAIAAAVAPPREPLHERTAPDPRVLAAGNAQIFWLVVGPAGRRCLDWRSRISADDRVTIEHTIRGPCFILHASQHYAMEGSTLRLKNTGYAVSSGTAHTGVGGSGQQKQTPGASITLLRETDETLETSAGVWYRTQAACEAARDGAAVPLDMNLLDPDVARMVGSILTGDLPVPQVDEQAVKALRAMLRRGHVYFVDDGPNGRACRGWQVRVEGDDVDRGSLVRSLSRGRTTTEYGYGYEISAACGTLMLTGPGGSEETRDKSSEVTTQSEWALGCAKILGIGGSCPGGLRVGLSCWYWNEDRCARALRNGEAGAIAPNDC